MILHDLLSFIWILLKIVAVLVPVMICVAFATLAERKIISYIQVRIGPNRNGFKGLAQPLADVIKLITKEVITPSQSNKYLFLIAPILSLAPALVVWSVIPFYKGLVIANINAGLLFIYAMSSLGIYGVLIGGWASNSKYAFYGAMRAAAQVVSYEIALGFCLVGIILQSGTLNLQQIVLLQGGGFWHWYVWPLLPLFVIFWIACVAETNRAPFDVAEGESEIVAGFHVEYSGMGFALYFLAEYAHMLLISVIISLFFLGGWLSPIPSILPNNIIWLFIKAGFFMYLYIWMRATFPRYRYDQIMYLGWKVLIPVALLWLLVMCFGVHWHIPLWYRA